MSQNDIKHVVLSGLMPVLSLQNTAPPRFSTRKQSEQCTERVQLTGVDGRFAQHIYSASLLRSLHLAYTNPRSANEIVAVTSLDSARGRGAREGLERGRGAFPYCFGDAGKYLSPPCCTSSSALVVLFFLGEGF